MKKVPKPQKTQTLADVMAADPATGIDLSKYPIGSPESRAAVRALLAQQPSMSQDDHDAILLHSGAHWLNAQTLPDSRELEATAVYQRGKALRESRGEKIIPYHLDPHAQRWSIASSAFELRFGREPKEGDVLRFADVQWTQALHLLDDEWFIQAWHRQIPNLMCPLKVENGKLYRHVRSQEFRDGAWKELRGGIWREEIDESPEGRWRLIERYAVGSEYRMPGLSEIPTIPAVTFIGVVDGKHRCRPSQPAEISGK